MKRHRRRIVSCLVIIKILNNKKEITMGDSKKRCEICNKPIDDGKLCSMCQIDGLKPMRDYDIEVRLKALRSAPDHIYSPDYLRKPPLG